MMSDDNMKLLIVTVGGILTTLLTIIGPLILVLVAKLRAELAKNTEQTENNATAIHENKEIVEKNIEMTQKNTIIQEENTKKLEDIHTEGNSRHKVVLEANATNTNTIVGLLKELKSPDIVTAVAQEQADAAQKLVSDYKEQIRRDPK